MIFLFLLIELVCVCFSVMFMCCHVCVCICVRSVYSMRPFEDALANFLEVLHRKSFVLLCILATRHPLAGCAVHNVSYHVPSVPVVLWHICGSLTCVRLAIHQRVFHLATKRLVPQSAFSPCLVQTGKCLPIGALFLL